MREIWLRAKITIVTPGRMKHRGFMQFEKRADEVAATGVAKSPLALEQENKQLKARVAELERLVVCDTLTPLFNRRHFMEELDRWCWRTHRYGGEYGLLFIDVDNLKAVNDRHGHLAGDVLLTAIAKSLLGAVRRSDLAARVGGDEFAILLDNIPESELAAKAERVVKSVGKLKIEHQGLNFNPSISAGYAVIEPGVKPSELLLRADRSMYATKQAKMGVLK
jgi:diguanylate cyclase (GGDEF)-like protein